MYQPSLRGAWHSYPGKGVYPGHYSSRYNIVPVSSTFRLEFLYCSTQQWCIRNGFNVYCNRIIIMYIIIPPYTQQQCWSDRHLWAWSEWWRHAFLQTYIIIVYMTTNTSTMITLLCKNSMTVHFSRHCWQCLMWMYWTMILELCMSFIFKIISFYPMWNNRLVIYVCIGHQYVSIVHTVHTSGLKQLQDSDQLGRSDKACKVSYNSQKILPEEFFASFATCSHCLESAGPWLWDVFKILNSMC